MKRSMINDLRLKIFIFLFLLFINHQSLFINHVFAADSTPSASIQSKLDELKKDIASKAAKFKETVNRKLKDKAYTGVVKSVSEKSITISSLTGPKIVSLNEDTIFESRVKTRKKLSQKTLSEEDFIAALGDVDETAVLTAKKIILLPKMKESKKTALWGEVVAVSDKLTTIKNKGNEQVRAFGTENTAVLLPPDSKVKLNNLIILTGTFNEDNIFEAEFVYIIPQEGIIKPKKIATPSAQVSTPSAKPAVKK